MLPGCPQSKTGAQRDQPPWSQANCCASRLSTVRKSTAPTWMGALDIWALPTRRTIWARAVSDPTRVALTCSASQQLLYASEADGNQGLTRRASAWGAAALLQYSLLHEAAKITGDHRGLTWHQDA